MLRSISPIVCSGLPERVLSARSLSSPAILRHCAHCGQEKPFSSSGKFRVNAQKRRLDVWLIRRCVACDTTWNQRLHQRVTPDELGDDLERYHQNDPVLADAVACDPRSLAAAGGTVVAGALSVELQPGPIPFVLRVELCAAVCVRLDRLLCQGLELSRSALVSRVERGEIEVERRLLSREALQGTQVIVRG